jgi:hypothetical protein
MKNQSVSNRRRALRVAGVSMILMLALAGCKRQKVQVQSTEEGAPRLASTVHMGDPKADTQLVNGFYGVEQNAWRWTAKNFSLVLHPPAGSAQRGATLQVKLTVPDVVTNKLKAVALSATVNGTSLAPETYSQPGDYIYTRDVPASALNGESVRVDFSLDKAMPPSGSDMRELGVVVLSAGLEPK